MIDPSTIQAAIDKAKPPSADAPLLNQSLTLASQGKFLQNPLDSAFSAIEECGIKDVAELDPAVASALPELSSFVAECKAVTSQMSDMKAVSEQMFTSVMPSNASLPSSFGLGNAPMPSFTQTASAVQAEQSVNERIGAKPENPCLPVMHAFEGVMNKSKEIVNAVKSLVSKVGDKFKEIMSAINTFKNNIVGAAAEMIASAKAQLQSAIGSMQAELNAFVSGVKNKFNEMKDAMVSSIKATNESIKKAMQVATVDMIKGMLNNNPCMKQILAPSEGSGGLLSPEMKALLT